MTLLLLLAGCGSDADRSRLPAIPDPPEVPLLPEEAPKGESRAFELNFGGGGAGAPYGMNLFVPPGMVGSVVTGPLTDGAKGATFSVPQKGDTVLCTSPVRIQGPFRFTARLRVAELVAAGDGWSGVDLELRARDDQNALVSPPDGTRFQRIAHWSGAGDWEDVDEEITPPAGAVKGELCLRFVTATGTVEVDRLQVETPGVPLPPPIPIVSVAWNLDEAGGGSGAPRGFDFLIPPGTTGATLTAGPLDGGATGIRMKVETPGNAVTCSQPFSVAPGMVARGRVNVLSVTPDGRPWTGFVAEVRTYDLVGGLASPVGSPFTPVTTLREATGWLSFEQPFAPPAEAVTGKLCFRFVESTGEALIDEASVGE